MESDEIKLIRRMDQPNKFDHVPKQTLCVVEDRYGNERERWIQRSENLENPRWERI